MTSSCIIIDPLEELVIKKDSTLAIIMAAQKNGWTLYVAQQNALLLKDGRVYARMQTIELLDISGTVAHWYELGESVLMPLADLDVILMRKDPPFNMDYIYSTYLLEHAEQEGVMVVNKPRSLRDCNEKFFATRFPDCIPPLLVSADAGMLKDFHTQYGDVVMKPLDGMGGESVFRLGANDKNRNVVIDTLTLKGQRQIMAQLFLPEIKQGDKRIILIDGKPVGYALARLPSIDENRANLATGGKGVAQPLTERDLEVAESVGSQCRDLGLLFVGLDVIGDYVTEINVTCPTGIREMDEQCGLDIGGDLVKCIQDKLVN